MSKKDYSRIAESQSSLPSAPAAPEDPPPNQPKKKRIRPRMLCLLVFVIIALATIVILGININSVNRQNEELRQKNSELDQNAMQLARDLEQCHAQIADLEKQVAEEAEMADKLQSANKELAAKVSTISAEKMQLEDVASFFEHAVIVPDDGSSMFHKYGCSSLALNSGYNIFSLRYAFSSGYTPCTSCLSTGYYIGNVNSHVYHLPTCWTLPDLKNRVYFETWWEAYISDYRPCKNCNP